MPSPEALATTQRAFAAAVLGGPDAAAPLLGQLRGEREATLRRLAAYHRNIVGNWIAALRSTCPQLAAALGPEAFDALARDYALSHDSASGDLNEYGADFADWLETRPESLVRPWLPDLARLEWDIQAAWYAADCAPFDFAALAGVPAELHGELRFRLAPAFRARVSRWPLAELWRDPGVTLEGPALYHVWVVRPFDRVSVESAATGEHAFVTALGSGRTLAAAIADASAADPDFAVGPTLARIAGLGLLEGFILPGESA